MGHRYELRLANSLIFLLFFARRDALSTYLGDLAEVETCEGCKHSDDIRVLKIGHDLNFLEITVLVDLISEFLLLERDRLYCINFTVTQTFNLAHDSKSSSSQQFNNLEVIRSKISTIHDITDLVLLLLLLSTGLLTHRRTHN